MGAIADHKNELSSKAGLWTKNGALSIIIKIR